MKSRIILKDGVTEVAFIPESEWERAALHQLQVQKVTYARWRNIGEQAMVVMLEEPLAEDAKSEGPTPGFAVPVTSAP